MRLQQYFAGVVYPNNLPTFVVLKQDTEYEVLFFIQKVIVRIITLCCVFIDRLHECSGSGDFRDIGYKCHGTVCR